MQMGHASIAELTRLHQQIEDHVPHLQDVLETNIEIQPVCVRAALNISCSHETEEGAIQQLAG